MKKKFLESYKRFQNWRNNSEDGKKIIGFCNWQLEHENFLLECWNHKDKGAVIFQIFSHGNGFMEYQAIEHKKTVELIKSIKSGLFHRSEVLSYLEKLI